MRLDKWLWAARFFKTRSLAAEAIKGGKIEVNGSRVKAARDIRLADELRIAHGDTRWTVHVLGLSEQRGPAPQARLLYAETAASLAAREALQAQRQYLAEPAAQRHGRPTKRDRRRLDNLG